MAEPATTVDDEAVAGPSRGAGDVGATPPPGQRAADHPTETDRPPELTGEIAPRPAAWDDVELLSELPHGGDRSRLHRARVAGREGEYVVKAYRSSESIEECWAVWQARRADSPEPASMLDLERSQWERGVAYELSRFYPARSLADHLGLGGDAARTMSDDELEVVVGRLAAAIGALQGIHTGKLVPDVWVHRDIKPSNVLVTSVSPLDVTLADLELVKRYDATDQQESGFRGTRHYSAPEVQSGYLSASADYWSLGMLLVHVGTGRHPLSDPDGNLLSQQSVATRTRELDLPPGLSVRMLMLVRGLLAEDQWQRFGDLEVRRWLEHQDQDLPTSAAPAPGQRETYRPAGSDRAEDPPADGFAFGGGLVATPSALAAAMGTQWEPGIRLLLGRDADRLVSWLDGIDAERSRQIGTVLERFQSHAIDGNRAVTEAMWILDPEADPVFRGWRCDRAALNQLIARGLAGEEEPRSVLNQLLESQALEVLSRRPGMLRLATVATRWTELTRVARTLIEREVPGGAVPDQSMVAVQILSALLARPPGRDLARAAAAARANVRASPGWFERIARVGADVDAPAHHAVVVLAAPLAEAHTVEVRPELEEWAREYLAHTMAEREEPLGVPGLRRRRRRQAVQVVAALVVALVGLGSLTALHLLDRIEPGPLSFALATALTAVVFLALAARLRPSPAVRLLALAGTYGLMASAAGSALVASRWSWALTAAWCVWLGSQLLALLLWVLSTASYRTAPPRPVPRKQRR
jgi:hypothetical protein